jgi:hypothetical protein
MLTEVVVAYLKILSRNFRGTAVFLDWCLEPESLENEAGVPTTRLWSVVTCRQGCGCHTEAVRGQAKPFLCPSRWLGSVRIASVALNTWATWRGDWSGLRSDCSLPEERVPDASWIGEWVVPSASLDDWKIPKYLASAWNRTTIPRSSIP